MHTEEINEDYIIKEKVIRLLETKGHLAFGDMVQELSESYETILRNVMDLKNQGILIKQADNGHFAIR